MRRTLWAAFAGMLWLGGTLLAQQVARTFEQDPLNQSPPGFVFSSLAETTGHWQVRGDRSSRYLAYAPEQATPGGQAIALLANDVRGRFRASVRLRFGDGVRAAGMVWRYQDTDNFYQAVLDLAGQEVALYRIVRGTRIKLEDEDDLELDPAAWHVMTVRQDGERVRIYLGGISVLRSRVPESDGLVGVWSSGGSATWFDDLRVGDEGGRRR